MYVPNIPGVLDAITAFTTSSPRIINGFSPLPSPVEVNPRPTATTPLFEDVAWNPGVQRICAFPSAATSYEYTNAGDEVPAPAPPVNVLPYCAFASVVVEISRGTIASRDRVIFTLILSTVAVACASNGLGRIQITELVAIIGWVTNALQIPL